MRAIRSAEARLTRRAAGRLNENRPEEPRDGWTCGEQHTPRGGRVKEKKGKR